MTKEILASATAALCLAAGGAHAADFSDTYFFGDSLTDGGSFIVASNPTTPPFLDTNRFTINPGEVWSQKLADYYGTSAVPYGFFVPNPVADTDAQLVVEIGGTNYAQGGARVAEEPGQGVLNAVPVSNQVDTYLGSVSGADADALYTVWGGANDVFFQADQVQSGGATPQQAAQNVVAAANAELAQLARLNAAGARYILVPNLPDIGKTLLAANGGPQAEALLTQLSQTFNQRLNSGIRSASFDVIQIDVYSLFDEVLATPAAYGFDVVTAPACPGSALQCTRADVANPELTYFFADPVHPSPAAHAILAQYAVSVIQAPQQISLLPNVAAEAGRAQAEAIDGHIRSARRAETGSGVNAFISGGYNDLTLGADPALEDAEAQNANFTAGLDWQIGEDSVIGVALGYTDGDADFGSGGGFEMQNKLVMLYAGTGIGGAYVNALAGMGWIDFDDVSRRINLGAASRVESGDTEGEQQVLRLSGGYRFDLGVLETGPIAALTWQRVEVDGYAESGNRSTSMRFDDQDLDSLVGGVGWSASLDMGDTAIGELTPYVRAMYLQEFEKRDREVSAELKTLPGMFSMPAYTDDRYFTRVEAGVHDRITEAVGVSLGVSSAFGLEGGESRSVMLGLTTHF